MEVSERLLRVTLTHLGFVKAYDERCKPLLNSLIAHHLSEDIIERCLLIVEMFKTEEYFIDTFLQDSHYDGQNDGAKLLLIHCLLVMKSSLEDKVKFFKDIVEKLKLQAIEQNKMDLIAQIQTLESKIPEIHN